jgi:hypothetical protein
LDFVRADVGREERGDDHAFTIRKKLDTNFHEDAWEVWPDLSIKTLAVLLNGVVHDTIGLFQNFGHRRLVASW